MMTAHDTGRAAHLEVSEEQSEVMVSDPANDNQQRYNKRSDLLQRSEVSKRIASRAEQYMHAQSSFRHRFRS